MNVLDIPTIIFGPLFIVVVALLAIGLQMLLHRALSMEVVGEHNDVIGFVIAVVGVIYAVALALLVVVVWEQFTKASDTALAEAGALTEIYQGVEVFPADASGVRAKIRDYNRVVVSEEWPSIAKGENSEPAERAALRVARSVIDLKSNDLRSSAAHIALLQSLRTFSASRHARLLSDEDGLPPIMWCTMIFGAAILIAFACLFYIPQRSLQYTLTGMLAAIVAVMFLLIIEINHPFRGDTSVTPQAFVQQRTVFQLIDEGADRTGQTGGKEDAARGGVVHGKK